MADAAVSLALRPPTRPVEVIAAPMAALQMHLGRVEQEAGKLRAALKLLAR